MSHPCKRVSRAKSYPLSAEPIAPRAIRAIRAIALVRAAAGGSVENRLSRPEVISAGPSATAAGGDTLRAAARGAAGCPQQETQASNAGARGAVSRLSNNMMLIQNKSCKKYLRCIRRPLPCFPRALEPGRVLAEGRTAQARAFRKACGCLPGPAARHIPRATLSPPSSGGRGGASARGRAR